MIAVRILRGFGLWNAGEIAGFPPERAAELIAGGYAAAIEEARPAPGPEPEPEPEPTAPRRARGA